MKSPRWPLLALAALCLFTAAPATTAELAQPGLADRVGDLEAYVNNAAPPTAAADFQKEKQAGPIAAVAGPGHNAWMMTATALVLFMTLPGLALFYGGLVRSKNVLSVLAQCLGIAGLVTILWWAFGYSLVFGRSFESGFLGGSEFFFLGNVGSAPNTDYAYWVSHNVFAMYQLMFAIITPALMIGAIAERMKFSAIMLFVGAWMFVVYFPLAHMVWGVTGCLNGVWNPKAVVTAVDFAGGTVVHMSSGWSALILCLLLGKRIGFGREPMPPHSMVLCMVGTGMLWVGWYGFNAGSAVAADGIAANAFMTTTLAAAVASFAWGMAEYILRGKPSVLGFCSGAVGGLVVITPACGFVTASGAILLGIAAGLVPFLACTTIKRKFGYDDALDTFGVHAVGGTLGAFLTGILATASVNGNLAAGAARENGLAARMVPGPWVQQVVHAMQQVLQQAVAILTTIVLAVAATFILAKIVDALVGLRAAEDVERQGLDLNEHGEVGYEY